MGLLRVPEIWRVGRCLYLTEPLQSGRFNRLTPALSARPNTLTPNFAYTDVVAQSVIVYDRARCFFYPTP